MSTKNFKKGLSAALWSLHNNMGGKDLRADIHDVSMNLMDYEDIEQNEKNAITFVINKALEIYHLCNRNEEEFNALIKFMDPEIKSNGRL